MCIESTKSQIIEPVLVQLKDELFTQGCSGILLGDKYVIITSHLLMSYIKLENLPQLNPSTINNSDFLLLKKFQFLIQTKNKFLNAESQFCLHLGLIENFLNKALNDSHLDGKKSKTFRSLLSIVFILEIVNTGGAVNNLYYCLNNLSSIEPKVGEEIFVESTPFGLTFYLNSLSHGIICNTFYDNSFLLIDSPLTQGCEGGLITCKNQREFSAIGFVLCCITSWQNSYTGLSIGISFSYLINQIFKSNNKVNRNICSFLDEPSKSLVKVISGPQWGTGILLNKEKGIFLTNSHVVLGNFITLMWQDFNLKVDVIFKTDENKVYDLAILKLSKSQKIPDDMVEIKISKSNLNIGDPVWAAGFPLFPTNVNTKATVTKGHVSKLNKTLINTTCSVLPGTSGGALLNQFGELVGVIVANLKNDDDIYPRVNFAIPISDIYQVLIKFIQTEDKKILHEIQEDNVRKRSEWQLMAKL